MLYMIYTTHRKKVQENLTFPKSTNFYFRHPREFVDAECGGQWPGDSWFDVGTRWSVNVWEEEGCRHITVYPDGVDQDGYRTTDAFVGIGIQ